MTNVSSPKARKPILCLDFDGVIHSYTSGWKGADIVSDPPVPNALEFVYDALEHFDVQIFSSRSHEPGGIRAMQEWLRQWAIAGIHDGKWNDDPMLCWLDCVKWPTSKPSAMVTIDDRALTFDGTWPAIEALLAFKPWNRLPPGDQKGMTSAVSQNLADMKGIAP